MFGRLGLPELILILAIALIIFGPRKLPEIGKSIGKGIREFKSATSEIQKSVNLEDEEQPKKKGAKVADDVKKAEQEQEAGEAVEETKAEEDATRAEEIKEETKEEKVEEKKA